MFTNYGFKKCIFPLVIFALVLSCVNDANALPQDYEVVSGTADFTVNDESTLTINASNNAIVNYKSFDIAANEKVIVNLPDSSSQILNRVNSGLPTNISGMLICDRGLIILVNTSGIYVASTANITAEKLVLSTRDITNQNFIAGNYLFEKVSGAAADRLLLNDGKINITNGGFGVLIAGAIENKGLITAHAGTIAMAGGDGVRIRFNGNSIISIDVEQAAAGDIVDYQGKKVLDQIRNSGTLDARGGTIILTADALSSIFRKAINLDGIAIGTKIEQKDGRIMIVTEGPVSLGGKIEATVIDIGKMPSDILTINGVISTIGTPDSVTVEAIAQIKAEEAINIIAENAVQVDAALEAPSVTIVAGGSIDTPNAAIIQGTSVNLTAPRLGTSVTPVHIQADDIHIKKLNGDIDIRQSIGIGTSVQITGPPDGENINIFYNRNASQLTLEGSRVIISGNEPAYFYGNTTFYNFSCTIPDKEIYFEAGKTYTFKGSLEIIGATYHYIKLLSQESGNYWLLNIDTADSYLERVYVDYASSIHPLFIPIGADSGNNINIITDPIWTGATSVLWSVGTNWDSGSVPTSQSIVTFNSTYNTNCTIDSIGTWGGSFVISAGYGGTITQSITISFTDFTMASGTYTMASGTTMTLSKSFALSGGTFNGHASGTTVDPTTTFTITGGIFNAPATLLVDDVFTVTAPGVFNHNNGMVKLNAVNNAWTMTADGLIFYNLTFWKGGGGGGNLTQSGSFTVLNDMNFENTASGSYSINSTVAQTITVYGNVNFPTGGTKSITIGSSFFSIRLAGNWVMNNAANIIFNGHLELIDDPNTAGIKTTTMTTNGTRISGDGQTTGFIDLTCVTPGKTIIVQAGKTLLVAGALTLAGTGTQFEGNRITLDSDNPGTQVANRFNMNVATVQYVNGVNVSNSQAQISDINGYNSTAVSNTDTGEASPRWFPTIGGYFIGGYVYRDEGINQIGSGVTIALSLNGGTVLTKTTVGSGYYIFNNLTAPAGSTALVYISGNAVKGNSVTLVSGTDIPDLDIYASTVTVRHDNAGPITNANIKAAKGSLTSTDILYSGDASNNITTSAATNFRVWKGKTYTPGADLSTTNLTVGTGATYNAGTSTITMAGNFTNLGTFTPGTSTANFTSTTTGKALAGSLSFYNVTFNGAAGGWTLGSNLSVANNLTLTNGTLDVSTSNYGITIGGNFARTSGTFTPRNGTVTFNDNTKTSTISGSTTFYNVACTTAGKTLAFTAGSTQTITGALTLTGSAGSLINIRSTVDGTQASINPQGTRSISYVDVKDSNNTNATIIDPTNSTDSGNTTNWFYQYSIAGTVYSDRGTTLIGQNKTIALVVNGVAKGTVLTDASSNYIFSSVTFGTGSTILVYISGDAVKGNTVTVATAANITGLNVYGNTVITRHEGAGPVTNATLATAKGSLTATDILYSVSGSDATLSSGVGLAVWAGKTYAPGGNLTCRDVIIQSGATYTAGSSTITASGNWTNAGTFTAGTSTVNLNGTAAQTVTPGGSAFNTLKINNAAGVTLGGAATVTTLTVGDVTANSVFDDGGYQVTSTGTLNLSNNSTFKLGSATAATTFPAFATRNMAAGTTVEYKSGVAQTVSTTPSYPNLAFSGTGTKTTESGTLTVGGNWSVGSATALNTNNTVVNLTGNLTGTGAITQGSGLITAAGDWLHTGAFTTSSAGVTLTGTGKQITGPAGGITFTTLSVNGTYTNNNTTGLTVSTALSGSGTLTQGSNTILNIGGTSGITGLDATASGNSVNYNGASAQTVKGTTYNTLKVNNATGATLGAPATVTTLTVGDVTASSIFDDGGNQLTSTGTLNLSNNSIFKIGSATAATTFPAFATRNIASGTTVEYKSGVAQTVSTTPSYSNLVFSDTGTKTTAAGTLTVGGNWSVGSDTTLATNNTAVNVSGNMTIASGVTYTKGSGALTFNGGKAQNYNDNTATKQNIGTIAVTGASTNLTMQTGLTCDGLTVQTNGTVTTGSNALTVGTGGVAINSTATLNATGTPTISVDGNWANNGTFTSGSSTVIFAGSTGSTSTISGTTSFNNLSCTVPSKILAFTAGTTQTVTGTLTLTGASGSLINIRSTVDGTQASINPQGTRSISYVDVKDSNNINATIIDPANSVDSGNTTNWFYKYSISGTVYSDRGTTLIGQNKTIALVINGVAKGTVLTDASSNYIFENISMSPGSAVLVYISGDAIKGNTVTTSAAANITSLNIYGNTVITRYEGAGPVTNATLNTAKSSLTNADILYSVSGSDATLSSGMGLMVWAGKTYTPGGNITCSDVVIQTGATYNAGSSTITASGNWTNAGTFNAGTSTVNLNGTAAQTVTPGGSAFNALKVNNTAGVSLGGAATVTTLTIGDVTANSIFNDNGYQVTSSGTLNLSNNSKFTLGSATAATTFPVFTTNNMATGTTIEYKSGVAQTVSTTPSYSNLIFSGAGTKTTAAGTLAVAGNWDCSAPTALNTNNTTVNLTGNLTGNGAITQGTGAINIAGNWTHTGTYTPGASGVVNYNGTSTQTVRGMTYNTLKINNSTGALLAAPATVTTLTLGDVTANSIFDDNGYQMTSTGTLNLSNNSTLKLGSATAATTLPAFATKNIAAGTTVEYKSGVAQTVAAGATYSNLTFSGAGTKTTATGTINVGGNWNVNSTTTLNTNNTTINLTGDLTGTGAITQATSSINIAGNWTHTGTYTPGANSIVNYNGTSAQTIRGMTYSTLKVNNTAGGVLGGPTTASTLTIGDVTANSIFDDNGYQLTSTNGTLNLRNNSTFKLGSATSATTFPAFKASNITIDAGTTIEYKSGIAQTVSTGPGYSNLTFSGAGTKTTASGTLSVGGNWSVDSTTALNTNNTVVSLTGNLTGAGAITQGTGLITAGGDWLNTGAFTASSAGVTLTGAGKQITGAAGGINFTTLTVNGTYINNNPASLTTSTALSGSGTLTQGANSVLNIGGTSGIANLVATASGNIVNYSGASAQTVKGTTYNTLTINNTAGATLGAAATVNTLKIGNITAGTIFDDGGNQITSTGTLELKNNSTLKLGAGTTATTFPGFTTNTIDAGTTVEYKAGRNQTVSTTPSYSNLVFSGANTKTTAAGTLTVGGNLDVGSTTALNTNNTVLNLVGDLTGTGAITQGTGIVTVGGNWLNSGAFTASSAGVTLTGTGKQITGAAGGINFTTLTVNGTYTNNNTTSLTASTALSGSGTLAQGTNSVLNIGGTDDIADLVATASGNTVNYNGASAQSVKAIPYNNLTFSGAGTKTTAAGTLDIAGNWNCSAPTALNTNNATVNLTGNLTGNGAITQGTGDINIAGNWTNTGTYTPGATSLVHYNGSSAQAVSGVPAYNNITFSGAGTKTLGGALTVSGNLRLEEGTLSVGGNNYAITVAGDWVKTGGTFNAGTGTVTFSGGDATIDAGGTDAGSAFYRVIVNSSGVKTIGSALMINNNLQVDAGTLEGIHDVTVKGGSVTGNGTINMTDGTFAVRGTGNFGGSTNNWTFYNLTFGDGTTTTSTTKSGTNDINVSNVLTISPNHALQAGANAWNLSWASYLKSIEQVAAGYDHTVALTVDGYVFAWGCNFMGQIGNDSLIDSLMPTRVLSGEQGGGVYLHDITQIAAGGYHNLAIATDGSVYSWGYNVSGQLGNGTLVDSLTPVKVLSGEQGGGSYLHNISKVAAGGFMSAAVTDGGFVFTWGYNGEGELGNGTLIDSSVPVQVLSGEQGGGTYLVNISQIAVGGVNMVALTNDGYVFTWGYNSDGELGDGTLIDSSVPVQVLSGEQGGGTYLHDVSKISSGDCHSIALSADGSVYSWGYNGYGELGDGTMTDSWVPARVLAGEQGGTYLQNIAYIAAGSAHTLAITSDGSLYSWGQNWFGQLGNGLTDDSSVPIRVLSGAQGGGLYLHNISLITAGGAQTVALTETSPVYSAGCNANGQLGNGTTVGAVAQIKVMAGSQAGPGTSHTPLVIGGTLNSQTSTFNYSDLYHQIVYIASATYSQLNINDNLRANFVLAGDVIVTGNVTINTAELSADSHNITVGGNWTNNAGIFIATGGIVTFNGVNPQLVISGASAFDVITIRNASTGGVSFVDRLVTNTLNAKGSDGVLKISFATASAAAPNVISTVFNVDGLSKTKLLELAPTTPGSVWYLDAPTGSHTFLRVSYSHEADGKTLTTTTSTDGGNNTNWNITP